jgi:hypothetical protein
MILAAASSVWTPSIRNLVDGRSLRERMSACPCDDRRRPNSWPRFETRALQRISDRLLRVVAPVNLSSFVMTEDEERITGPTGVAVLAAMVLFRATADLGATQMARRANED